MNLVIIRLFKFKFYMFWCFAGMCASIPCVCAWFPHWPEKDVRSPGTEVTEGYELPCGCYRVVCGEGDTVMSIRETHDPV